MLQKQKTKPSLSYLILIYNKKNLHFSKKFANLFAKKENFNYTIYKAKNSFIKLNIKNQTLSCYQVASKKFFVITIFFTNKNYKAM